MLALAILLLSACTGEVATYTVTFDSDGGSAIPSVTVNEGECADMPAPPSKYKQDFVGWYLDGAEYDFASPVTADIRLTAKWAPSMDITSLAGKWTGSESASGGEYEYELIISASGTPELSYVDAGARAVLDVKRITSVEGKSIVIDYLKDGTEGSIAFKVAETLDGFGIRGGALTLTKAEEYVITYHMADGKTVNVCAFEGEGFSHPEGGVPSGAALDGWYTAEGERIADDATVDGNVELYQSVYTIGLQITDGTVTGYEGDSRKVVIPGLYKGAHITAIGEGAFAGKDITSVKLPKSLYMIGNGAFRGCTELMSIDLEGVWHIGEYAFFDCNELISVTVTASTKSIGKGAFGSTLLYSEHDGYTSLSPTASSLKTIVLPFVGGGAEENSFLAYIFGAETYDSTNYYDEGIEVEVDGEKRLVNYVNYIPTALESVYVNSGTAVPDYAFYNCFYLDTVTFSEGIKTVGKSSFEGCYSMTFDGLQEVEWVGDRAFLGSAFLGNYMPKLKHVGSMAFAATYMSLMDLGSELQYIGDSAFAYSALYEITIPKSVVEIGDAVFFGCDNLASVTFEASVPCDIGSTLFAVVEDDVAYYSDVMIWVPNGDSYKLYREKVNLRDYAASIFPVALKGKSGYVTLDGSLLGYIGEEALEVVRVPDGVTEIADFAFYNCPSITDVIMPEGFLRIGRYAFYNCTSVARLEIPSTLVEIDDYAFTGFFVGNNISRLYLPEGFKRIGDGAFLSSFNMRIVELPSTLEHIGYLAFGMSNSLERMHFASATPPTVGSYENDVGEVYREIFSIINAGKTTIYVPSGRVDGVSVVDTYRATEGFSQFADYIKSVPGGAEVGHYGDGSVFIDLDGCDTVVLSILKESENDTSDFGGSRYELVEFDGTYTINGSLLKMELEDYGAVTAVYMGKIINLSIDGAVHRLVEPDYYYDSYNWTNFRLYHTTATGGNGLFDMYGSFITPFEWRIEGGEFFISIDGNNKLPENSAYAGVVEYKGEYDAAEDVFTVSFMLNDYAEIMNFKCERNDVIYASGEASRLYGTYKVFAENNPDYAMFTIVSDGTGVLDIYIGDVRYENCKYNVADGVVTIDFQTMTLTFTMTKDGYLVGDFFGTDCCFIYVDELMDSTRLPGRDDVGA